MQIHNLTTEEKSSSGFRHSEFSDPDLLCSADEQSDGVKRDANRAY